MFDIAVAFCDDEVVEQNNIAQTPLSNQNVAENISPTSPKQKLTLVTVSVAVVVLLGILGAGAIYFTSSEDKVLPIYPTSSPTQAVPKAVVSPEVEVEWKTHEVEKYKLSMEYPSNWSVRAFESGAAFSPLAMPGYPDKSDAVSLSIGSKMGNYMDMPLEEYAKIAASSEIQNYGELASIKKVTSTSGVVGYQTTWVLQSFLGRESGTSVSLPITYFELPDNKTQLVRVTLDRAEDLEVYEKMLQTVKFKTSVAVSPTAPVDESSILKSVIGTYIAQKSGGDASSLSITVSKVEGDYARGMASDGAGGGMWFAAKVDGAWKLVWDGNGIIQCSDLALYPAFPTSMIPTCFDDVTQETLNR